MLSKEEIPLVSVFMITYNHEDFIREAIEGVLNQKTNFNVKLVIGEDCSTDKTLELIYLYMNNFPEKIQLIRSETNVGVNQNVVRTLNACNGKYVAMCEGDDYWTDPLKLQTQVDFLEKNIDFSFTFHRSTILYNQGESSEKINTKNENSREYFADEIYEKMPFQLASLVFRRENLILPKNFDKYVFPDNGIILALLDKGRSYGFGDVMSVYRKHAAGLSVPSWTKAHMFLEMMDLIDLDFGGKFAKSTRYRRVDRFYYMANYYLGRKEIVMVLRCLAEILKLDPLSIFKKKFNWLIVGIIVALKNKY